MNYKSINSNPFRNSVNGPQKNTNKKNSGVLIKKKFVNNILNLTTSYSNTEKKCYIRKDNSNNIKTSNFNYKEPSSNIKKCIIENRIKKENKQKEGKQNQKSKEKSIIKNNKERKNNLESINKKIIKKNGKDSYIINGKKNKLIKIRGNDIKYIKIENKEKAVSLNKIKHIKENGKNNNSQKISELQKEKKEKKLINIDKNEQKDKYNYNRELKLNEINECNEFKSIDKNSTIENNNKNEENNNKYNKNNKFLININPKGYNSNIESHQLNNIGYNNIGINYNEFYFYNNDYNNLNNNELVPNEFQKNFNQPEDDLQESIENYIEQNDNKKNKTNINNTQLINTSNGMIDSVFLEMFNTTEINLETKTNMQLLRKKRKRRTKIEIENDKENEKEKKINNTGETIKKKGRKSRNMKNKEFSVHSRISDDNIMKKINSNFLESVRNWLNKSFIDDNGHFEGLEERKKSNKKLFFKIRPTIITTNLKRECMMNTMNLKFKQIFSNKISTKYSKNNSNYNEVLIDEIYENKNQVFILFILELTFIETFNYFNGQISGDNFIKKLIDKIDTGQTQMIEQFLGNFDKIDKFLKNVFDKQDKNESNDNQDYLQRISILCLNYEKWFEKKFNRGKNKKKK